MDTCRLSSTPTFPAWDMVKREANTSDGSRFLDDRHCSLEEIAERIEFMAAVQKGLDQLDRGEGVPHDEVKRQLASWLTN